MRHFVGVEPLTVGGRAIGLPEVLIVRPFSLRTQVLLSVSYLIQTRMKDASLPFGFSTVPG